MSDDTDTTGCEGAEQGGPWYAVVLSPKAWPAESAAVRADGFQATPSGLRLDRDGRTVFSVDRASVRALHRCDHQRAALDALREARGPRHGGSTMHLEERTAAAARGRQTSTTRRGGPAEGIAFRIED